MLNKKFKQKKHKLENFLENNSEFFLMALISFGLMIGSVALQEEGSQDLSMIFVLGLVPFIFSIIGLIGAVQTDK